MHHRNRRLATIAVAGIVLAAAVGLGLTAMRSAIVYFYSPSEVLAAHPALDERVRVGGLVETGSVGEEADGTIRFVITDGAADVAVRYAGILPDLFREGQGVIVQGRFTEPHLLSAETVLAKHDETYMPPEVAEALRESGVWQGEAGADGPPAGSE